jgi:glucose/arabinose dehydrogenase
MLISNQSLSKVIACATLLLALSSCSSGGSDGGSTTAPPAGSAKLAINSPTQGASLSPGPVLVTFDIQNSPVPLSATQPRMHFYVDNDPVPYKFYDGPGITENGSTSGVRYQGLHTHFVHWKSGGSIQLNALASGPHQVQFVLGDAVTNLVTAYGMNEGSGTTLADASGSGHTGTLVDYGAGNGPAWVAGQTTYGQALSFDGLDDAVSVANPGTYNFGTADFTLETWVKRDVLGGGQRHLFSTCTVPTWMVGCKEFYFNANNQLTFGSKSTGDTFSSTIADTAWHHIAVTFTNSTKAMQFYVDGALATTATKALEADNPGHIMTIGNLFGDNSFSGLLDEFRIYNRVLTLAEIQAEVSSTAKTLTFTILPGTGGDFSLQEVVGNLNFPAAMATAPDGRIFVNELKTGDIRVVTPKPQPQQWDLQTTPFAHLDVQTLSEQGLLGIAVDPNFNSNHFVYVFYTAASTINRIGRFTATTSSGNTVATSTSPTVIFDNIPAAIDHNGGFIQFGPDGMLYIFVGENDMPAEAQKLDTLRGKILRINPNGTIPSDNPFPNNPPANPAIYSYGHRNGFGFTFHPLTHDLWETENGETTDDQINRIIAGGNYGWNLCSGICTDPPFNAPPYVNPIITFNPCCMAPTGIVAIREDSVYPAQYHNNLLFADFNFGRLHRIVLGGPLLTDYVSDSIVCDCGQGGLLAVMHGLNLPGQDGYIYVTNGSSIFRVVLN